MLNLEKPVDRHGRSFTIRDNLDDPDEMKLPMHQQLIWLYLEILKNSWKYYSMRKYLQILYGRSNKILVLFKIEWCLNGCAIKNFNQRAAESQIFDGIFQFLKNLDFIMENCHFDLDYPDRSRQVWPVPLVQWSEFSYSNF